jgi:hypothetical protein
MKKLLNDSTIPDHKIREEFQKKALSKQEDGTDHLWKNWLVGKGENEHVALDYKISIFVKDTNVEIISTEDKVPMFFGNMGEEYADKPMCLITCEKVKIFVLCLNQELRLTIKDNFPFFITRINFGTRQDKGYGSFSFHKDDKNEYFPISHYLKGNPYLKIDQQDWRSILFVVNYYYQRLKSGVNYNYNDIRTGRLFCHYHPSFFRDFMYIHHSVQWEKPWLKQMFFPVSGSLNNPKFARAFLGLSQTFEFKTKRNPCNLKPATYPMFNFGVKVKSDNISRHKSPITFKPIITNKGTEIYVLAEKRFWDPICNQQFSFEENGRVGILYTPSNGIDINLLIKEYNKSLGTLFTAIDFKGEKLINVSIL